MNQATQRYNVHMESIAFKLGALRDWLDMQIGLQGDPVTWADVGEAANVSELLGQICESLQLDVELEA